MSTVQVNRFPKIKTVPMDPEWKQRLQKRNRAFLAPNSAMAALRRKLLSIGGEEVCFPDIEMDAQRIIDRGEIFASKGAILRKGAPCQCHSNSAKLWDANSDKLSICTGYALAKDGLWRQHSWAVFKGAGGSVVETTVRRLLYFGVRLTEMEAETFFSANC